MELTALEQVRAALASALPCLELELALAAGEPIPTELIALTELELLRVVSPGCVQLPRWFGRMRGLIELEIDAELPAGSSAWVAEIDTLERLRLRCADGFDPGFAELPVLRELELALAQLGEVPLSLAKRTNLETVRIHARTLECVPLGLLVAPNIRTLTLDFDHTDARPAFPRLLPGLSQLECLAVGGWPLGEIPSVLLQLEQLDTLTLRRCELSELPRHDWGRAIGLRHLDVSFNQLSCAPASLATLTGLRELVLADNPIVQLDPALAQLSALERLDLDGTGLVRAGIPRAIAELPQLRVLSTARTPTRA